MSTPGTYSTRPTTVRPTHLSPMAMGEQCLGVNDDYINNCNYDMAGHLLEHIYGRLNPPSQQQFDRFDPDVRPK